MPNNPHILRKGTRDPGAAQQLADVRRQASKANRTYLGAQVAMPGFVTGHSDSEPVVATQGPDSAVIPGAGAGVFVSSGPTAADIDVALTPTEGIILTEGIESPNQLQWVDTYGGADVANIGSEVSGANRVFGMAVFSPDGSTQLLLTLEATNGGHATLKANLYTGTTLVASDVIWNH